MTHPAAPVAADVPSIKPLRRAGSWLLNAAIFFAAFAVACSALGWVAPFPEVPGIYPKWSYFQQRRDQFEVLFVGSSRFYHQIIPAQFDAAVTAASGQPLRSFNFGYDGMWPPESYYLLRQILATKPARLKWVVIDLIDISVKLDSRNNSTLRMTYWHDTQHTAIAFREILASRQHWSRRLELFAEHGRLWFTRTIGLGRGADLFAGRLNPRGPRKKPYSWSESSGYEAGPDLAMEGAALQEFEKGVAGLRSGMRPIPVRPLFRRAIEELIADIRRAGAEPIFVIAPTLNRLENYTGLPSGTPLFSLNDPADYPQLYDPAHYYDPWHLNGQGAILFTDILAKRFIEQTRVQP